MAKHKDEEPKPAIEMSPRGDAKSVPPRDAESGEGPHHAVHLDSERVSRLRKRPTRF
ncbi:MAG: hypothetical protein ISS15_02935 [Alphaproteobacteria bacterium]|nr:hypothetical protein [Alphaproteobacteria bacterium]MBL7096589.1 hypothetical protein [Alphaproteobacteria bacterium]